LSFRGRLTLFFLLIVVLPMIAVAVLVTQVTTQSRNGKADARLAAGLETALSINREDAEAAKRAARKLGRDPDLGAALQLGDSAQIRSAARAGAQREGIRSLVIRDPNGRREAAVGPSEMVAPYQLSLRGASGELGTLVVSTTTPSEYLRDVRRLTARDAALLGEDGDPISQTLEVGNASLPGTGHSDDVEIGGDTLRAATTDLPGTDNLRLALFGPTESGGFFSSSPLVAAVLVAFFAVALIFVAMLLRALGGQVAEMLDAARRIGQGDFSHKVPVVGKDEMAGLASEFNKMSDRLSTQMDALRRQQIEIDRSVARIGEAFASGLDRQALLQVVVETSLGACRAEYGMIALSGREGAEAEAGRISERLQAVADAAKRQALARDDAVSRQEAGFCALAGPLRRLGEAPENVGVMTVAREGEPFGQAEQDVFLYLVGQVSASIENIALHELVSEQAVTDELTGLSNNRRFRELIAKEAARAQRFRHDLSLIMLDIDDFKRVNDTHGHLQGDEVLRTIGAILSSESRGVDEPARYGGEEFAVALPETGLDGALELAERIRARIESEAIPRLDGSGAVRVTASLGAASMPASADSAQALIAAADTALYEAKRAGKNRVSEAPAASPAGRS
jgi:diguanylate cyclase (GGDEF)-like protein